ncbi:unnamed protein product [Darwinula stevensoni]|uniref:Alkyl transferase n=1 Tax=Darwinula stevensoni TaxID=69355 RepID=A0A7R8X7T8_9CRUS|nr:unnamed protein product [Darwinula stevensoni]CAG0887380.1 unnamed protein product [Darwinula stevensoni]
MLHSQAFKGKMKEEASEWFQNRTASYLESFVVKILKKGPVPRHIAIIMDGNRRYASKHHLRCIEGHSEGFKRLTEVLWWCRELGIKEVTIYAFSIENFKRTQEEVSGLMTLAQEKMETLLKESNELKDHGVRIQFLGNRGLLSEPLRALMSQLEMSTRDHKNATLNVAFSYTSRDEIVRGIQHLAQGVQQGLLDIPDIHEELLDFVLDTRHTSPCDLVIRTSGEVRLSDFILWQVDISSTLLHCEGHPAQWSADNLSGHVCQCCCLHCTFTTKVYTDPVITCPSGFSCIYYTKILWPEFSSWHLFAAILYYQLQYPFLKEGRQMKACQQDMTLPSEKTERDRRIHAFLATHLS